MKPVKNNKLVFEREISCLVPATEICKSVGACNSEVWFGWPSETWLLCEVSLHAKKKGFWGVKYVFMYSKALWQGPGSSIPEYDFNDFGLTEAMWTTQE